MGGKRLDFTPAEIKPLLKNSTYDQIAEEMGCSPYGVFTFVRKNHLDKRDMRTKNKVIYC